METQEEIIQPIVNVSVLGYWQQVKARIKLRKSLFIYPIGSMILGNVLVRILSLGLGLLAVYGLFAIIFLGFVVGTIIYIDRVDQLSLAQLPTKKYDNVSIVIIGIIYLYLEYIVGGSLLIYVLLLNFVFVQNLKKSVPIFIALSIISLLFHFQILIF